MSDTVRTRTSRPRGPAVTPAAAGTGDAPQKTPSTDRRHHNPTLRNLVDGLLDHVRDLSDRVDALAPEELEAEHEQFNLIAELTWAAITDEKKRPVRRAEERGTG